MKHFSKIATALCAIGLSFSFFGCQTDVDSPAPTYYIVTFDTNGGSPASIAPQTIVHGKTATKPADPTKEGFASMQWYNGETIFDFATPIVSDITLTARYFYFGSKAPTETKAVGDIVFSDGSATPYSEGLELTDEKKAAAIAVIFYKGTELYNDDDNAETKARTRTLGVGLVHGRSLKWCTDSAGACNTNITATQCPASGSSGALDFTGHRNGSDNFTLIGQALGSDDTTTSGAADRYPAFYFARDYKTHAANVAGTAYEDDWYVPSIAELFQVWKQITTLNAVGTLCGTDTYGADYYWSSSQYASQVSRAYVLGFYWGNQNVNYDKSERRLVCIVREF